MHNLSRLLWLNTFCLHHKMVNTCFQDDLDDHDCFLFCLKLSINKNFNSHFLHTLKVFKYSTTFILKQSVIKGWSQSFYIGLYCLSYRLLMMILNIFCLFAKVYYLLSRQMKKTEIVYYTSIHNIRENLNYDSSFKEYISTNIYPTSFLK